MFLKFTGKTKEICHFITFYHRDLPDEAVVPYVLLSPYYSVKPKKK